MVWNEESLKGLVRKMKWRRSPGQGRLPQHIASWGPSPQRSLLTKIVEIDSNEWAALGYTETDRVSGVQYLGSLGCRTGRALSHAAGYQQPLTLELAKALIDAGAFNEYALRTAAAHQQPLTLELAKLLIDAGCNPAAQNDPGWDALVCLAVGGFPVDPQVTDLLLAAECRRDLDECKGISDKHRLRFDQILKEHAEWKEKQDRLLTENSPTDTFYGPDWGR